jgi:hypothetical protein
MRSLRRREGLTLAAGLKSIKEIAANLTSTQPQYPRERRTPSTCSTRPALHPNPATTLPDGVPTP